MSPDEVFRWLRSAPGDPTTAREVLISQLPTQLGGADRASVTRALDAATGWHEGQKRADGTPYIVHPIRVAILAQSLATLCAADWRLVVLSALLHDTLEDTRATRDVLMHEFGDAVAEVVECLTAAPDMAEDVARRQRRKVEKWTRVGRSPLQVRLVHCCDVVDNLCALRFLDLSAEGARKIPRWLMQAETYQRPIAEATSELLVDAIDTEIAFEKSRGVRPGTWGDA